MSLGKKIIKIFGAITAISAFAGGVAFTKEYTDEKRGLQSTPNHEMGIYEHYIKRPLDCTLATGALLVFSPILTVTAIIVRMTLGSPVLFSQVRPGKDEKLFKLYKFRTMTEDRDDNGNLLPDDARLTPIGRAIRLASIDELPELINIIKGDMSIIGNRVILGTTGKISDFSRVCGY